MQSRTFEISRQWREGKVRPVPGNPPHDRPVSRGMIFVKGEFATIPSTPLASCSYQNTEALSRRFSRHGGIYRSDVVSNKTKPWGGTILPPAGRARTQVQERAGRITPFSSSAMSSDRLFLDRVGRHQSPSPLHRHGQINMAFPGWREKGTFLLCWTGGHFYFAATWWSKPLAKQPEVCNNLTPIGVVCPIHWDAACY
jgi:hypothetical protein